MQATPLWWAVPRVTGHASRLSRCLPPAQRCFVQRFRLLTAAVEQAASGGSRVPKAARSEALHVCLVAGEPSGDSIGGALMGALRLQALSPPPALTVTLASAGPDRTCGTRAAQVREQHGVDVRFSGVGGPSMRAQGLEPIFDMSELAVMGVFELLPHLFRLRWRLREAIAHIQDEQPDILVTIDAKGFNFRLLRALADAPALAPRPTVAHYVAPSIWAYKGSLRTPPDRARPQEARTSPHGPLILLPHPRHVRRGTRADPGVPGGTCAHASPPFPV